MRIYSNVYNYAIYLKLLVFLRSLLYIHINTHNNYRKKVYIETPKIFYHDTHKILKKCFFFVHSMSNINQNNEIEYINKEISLLQDRLKINEKSLNQFQNVLMRIKIL